MSFDKDITPRLIKEKNATKVFEGTITQDWFIIAGPNGGFIAALLLKAMVLAQDQTQRQARSFSIDYFAPPKIGAVEIETQIIRQGRSLTSVSAKMMQAGKLQAQAIASFASSYEAHVALNRDVMPKAKLFAECDIMPSMLPIHDQYEMRPAFGALPFSGGSDAISGGWTVLRHPPEKFSAEMLAAISDCWPPSLFSIMNLEQFGKSQGLPTIELSVYFTNPEKYADLQANDPVLARFETGAVNDGFFIEDGELWTMDGVLLARVRQIAIAR